jgi:hypothetical protein
MRSMFWSGVVVALLLFSHPAAADPQCDKDKAALAKLDKAIGALENATSPSKMASDLIDLIDVLNTGLKNTKGDLKKITSPVKEAQGKLKELTEKLDKAGQKVPPGVTALKSALDNFSKSINAGVKKYKASAPGEVASGLEDAQGYIDTITGTLDSVRAGLAEFKAFDDAANGSGADQIRAMKMMFDKIKTATGAGEVPGVGQFLDAYSTALDGIANNVNQIETTLKDRLKMANEALEGTDFGNIDALYPGLQSEQQKKDAALAALHQQRTALADRIDAAGCNQPPPKADPCKGKPAQTRDLVDRMTAKQSAAYESASTTADNAQSDLFNHAMQQPQPPLPSGDVATLTAAKSLLARLQAIAASGYATVYDSQGGADMVRALGGTVNTSSITVGAGTGAAGNRVSVVKGQVIPALASKIASLQKTAQQQDAAAKARYDTALKSWNAQLTKLKAAAKDASAKRAAAKDALDKAIGDATAQEAAAKKWSEDDQKQYDECFPEEGTLRRKSQPRFPIGGTSSAAPKCERGGGLAGAMNNEACQISGGTP